MRIKSTLIIAEAGVNHNGSINTAKKLIDVAADAGADFVKFQTFKADRLVTRRADKANYQKDLVEIPRLNLSKYSKSVPISKPVLLVLYPKVFIFIPNRLNTLIHNQFDD